MSISLLIFDSMKIKRNYIFLKNVKNLYAFLVQLKYEKSLRNNK